MSKEIENKETQPDEVKAESSEQENKPAVDKKDDPVH